MKREGELTLSVGLERLRLKKNSQSEGSLGRPSTVHFNTFSPELKRSLVIILALLLTHQFVSQLLQEDSTDSV